MEDSNKVSASEFARIVGKSAHWICRLCREGRLSAERVGNTWMVDPLAPLPPDPRILQRAKRERNRDRLAKERRMAVLSAELAPAKTWRDCTPEELEEDYTSSERKVLEAIKADWLIDANGTAFVRADAGDSGAQAVQGTFIRPVKVFAWNDDMRRFYRSMGGFMSIEALLSDK